MSNGSWTDDENDLIVADYFAMLSEDTAGRRYSKTEHRRTLLPLLNDRSEGSVEFKDQNISAMLKGLGENWSPGYKPAFDFQMTLVDTVARWLALHPDWLRRMPGTRPATGLQKAARLWIGPPPTLSNQPPPQELEQMLHIARKFHIAGRDERNRALGRAGGRMSGLRFRPWGGRIWRARYARYRKRMAMARAAISRASHRMGGRA